STGPVHHPRLAISCAGFIQTTGSRQAQPRGVFDEFTIGAAFAVAGPQSETARCVTDFSWWAFDFDKPSAVRNVIKANRAPVQPILLAEFGVSFFDPEIEQFKNALGGPIFDGRFHFHTDFLVSIPARAFESEHGNFPTV